MTGRRRSPAFALLGTALLAATGARPVGAAPGPFDGRYEASVTIAQLRHAGSPPALAKKLFGRYIAVYGNGRVEFRNQRTGAVTRGRYTVRGDVARVVFAGGIGLRRGAVSECTWNVYRGRLTFKAIVLRPSLLCDAPVWVRAG